MAERSVADEHRLTVVTPSLPVAATLGANEDIAVILLGRRVRRQTLGTSGPWVTDMLSDLLLDLAFLGATGISLEHGLTTLEPSLAAIKGKVLAQARRHEARTLRPAAAAALSSPPGIARLADPGRESGSRPSGNGQRITANGLHTPHGSTRRGLGFGPEPGIYRGARPLDGALC